MNFLLRLLFGSNFGRNKPKVKGGPKPNRPPPIIEKAYKIQALSEVEISKKIKHLPVAQVIHVKDGDSVVVTILRDENVVRLDSVDCPEDGQPWGNIAAAGLVKLIGGKIVHLEQHGQDQYGRTLATIYVWNNQKNEWINVNERMVMLGHAWVMRRYYDHLPPDRQQKLNRLESWAKSKQVGLWKQPNPIPPWNWRGSQV